LFYVLAIVRWGYVRRQGVAWAMGLLTGPLNQYFYGPDGYSR
jgi:hypothetical protein